MFARLQTATISFIMSVCLSVRPSVLVCVEQLSSQWLDFNPLNTKLNPICHLLALLGAHHILHVSRIRVNEI